MEIKFNETALGCTEHLTSQRQQQEQTLEIRLPDGMPDAGRILGVWGQPVIRGKEWRTGSVAVTGGTMVWILYAPEDDTAPRCMDGWMPYQMQWDIPDHAGDGFLYVCPRIRSMDARTVSARKIMVRATLSISMEALVPGEKKLYTPHCVPEDIQLLQRSYPMEWMMECGEKAFQIDEDIIVPGNYPTVNKIVRYEVLPEVTEQKVIAGRLVFRGICKLHMLYSSEDGLLTAWDQEIPFSQYAELGREYSDHASATFQIVPSGMELERIEDGKLLLKCSAIAQYILYDRVMVDAVEDAYSPCRELNVGFEMLELPVRLDMRKERVSYTKSMQAGVDKVIDQTVFWDNGNLHRNGDSFGGELVLQHQILAYDGNGKLCGASVRGAQEWSMLSNADNQVILEGQAENLRVSPNEDSCEVSGSMDLNISVFARQGLNVVTGIEYGEKVQPDAGRPSLILRRTGEQLLWEIAKECGSTVDAIKQANKLQQEPAQDQMLLIPVY